MSKIKLSLKRAQSLTDKIIDALEPGCERIECAGSVRRGKAEVGDLEIVCIPKSKQVSMFGEMDLSATHLDDILKELMGQSRIYPGHACGPKYKSFLLPAGCQLDLFIVTPPEWGVCFTIRTGSADFSRRLVSQRALMRDGLLPGDVESGRHWYVKNNRLYKDGERVAEWKYPDDAEPFVEYKWEGGTLLDTPSEKALFDLVGGPGWWIEPKDRD